MKKTYLFCFENDQEKMLTELKKKKSLWKLPNFPVREKNLKKDYKAIKW